MRQGRSVEVLAAAALALMTTAGAGGHAASAAAAQLAGVERALGAWHSTEQFEGESRVSVSFARQGSEVTGRALMLGQMRKGNDHTTLGLSFCGATWSGDRLRFQTILPEDEGTIGWELRVLDNARGVLVALTENGNPIPDSPTWDVRR
jgi:hypothetical protein